MKRPLNKFDSRSNVSDVIDADKVPYTMFGVPAGKHFPLSGREDVGTILGLDQGKAIAEGVYQPADLGNFAHWV